LRFVEEISMRFIFGVIVGAALTVGFAYVHDLGYPAAPPAAGDSTVQKPFVNWDAVSVSSHAAATVIREQWDKLTSK
jgi:RsiW-degrading membrane proteinase PrsW (M82 family)